MRRPQESQVVSVGQVTLVCPQMVISQTTAAYAKGRLHRLISRHISMIRI